MFGYGYCQHAALNTIGMIGPTKTYRFVYIYDGREIYMMGIVEKYVYSYT